MSSVPLWLPEVQCEDSRRDSFIHVKLIYNKLSISNQWEKDQINDVEITGYPCEKN